MANGPILDYRPDLPADTPGVLQGMIDMMPTARGYRCWVAPKLHTSHTLTLGASESPVSSLYATRWLSTPGGIVVAGTDTDLYVYDYTNGFGSIGKGGGYSLVSSVSLYGEDASAAFDICSFGDVLIAAHKSTKPQYRTATTLNTATKFADLGTTVAAPKASVCATASNFCFLGDLNSTWGSATTVVGARDMVAWCGIGDHQNWDITPLSSQGSYAQFNDTPGPITALAPLNDGIVVFKAASMYYGRYVGAGANSPIWDFVRISDRIGCVGHRSVTNIGGQLVFAGLEDVYIFDGTKPRSITDGIWETHFRDAVTSTNIGIYPTWVAHDRLNNCVIIRPPGSVGGSGVLLLWSYRYNRWGRLLTASNGGDISGSGYNGINVFCKTNTNDFRTVTTTQSGATVGTDHSNLSTLFMTSSARNGSSVATACKAYNRTITNPGIGTFSNTAQISTWAVGDEVLASRFLRVSPKVVQAHGIADPAFTAGTCVMQYKKRLCETWASASAVSLDANRRFDLQGTGVASANWAYFDITFTDQLGSEVIDVGISRIPAGTT